MASRTLASVMGLMAILAGSIAMTVAAVGASQPHFSIITDRDALSLIGGIDDKCCSDEQKCFAQEKCDGYSSAACSKHYEDIMLPTNKKACNISKLNEICVETLQDPDTGERPICMKVYKCKYDHEFSMCRSSDLDENVKNMFSCTPDCK